MSKQLACILCFLFCFGYSCLAQWQWLNPKPSGFTNTNVVFTNDQHGFILNDNGDLFVSNNQGQNWQLVQHFAGKSVFNIKDSTGVIAGNGSSIFISKDNGVSWEEKQTNIQEYGIQLINIVSRDTFFLATSGGHIYRTSDRGESWTPFDCGNTLSAIFFINSKIGFAGCTATSLLKTEDGGKTWKAPSSDGSVPWHSRAIFFLNEKTGFVSDYSNLKQTTDGGKTWRYSIGAIGSVNAIFFPSKDTGYTVGSDVICRTTTGGASWDTLEPIDAGRDAYSLNSLYFVNGTIGFAAGMRGRILKTTNSGTSWQPFSPDYFDISALSFPTPATGYMAASFNVYKSTDSGKSWLPASIPPDNINGYNSFFEQCYFASADTGFITASQPARLLYTNSGGKSWISRTFLDQFGTPYDNFFSTSFISKTTGFIDVTSSFGASCIYKTTDAGATWQQMGAPNKLYFQHIFFLDEKTGYACDYGYLYKTEDGAQTWKQIYYTNYGTTINSICFTDAKTGYIAGDQSLLQMTNDSGKTWTSIDANLRLPSNYLAIKFYDKKIGHFTTDDGSVLRTTNGGLTWQYEDPLPLGNKIINYGTDSSLYVAGRSGTIVKTNLSKYNIENLQANSLNSCSAAVSALVTTVLSRADSLRFEYGIEDFRNSIAAIPDSVINEQKTIVDTITDLQPGTTYQFRVKLFYKGKYEYSEPLSFTTISAPAAPEISINGLANVCEGDSVILQSSATGNHWLLNGMHINGADSSVYVAHTSGSYSVVDSTTCTSAQSAAVVITVNQIPIAPTITANGNVLLSSALMGNQWYKNDTLIVGAINPQYNASTSGSYTVQATVNGCTSPLSAAYTFALPDNGRGMFNGEVQYGPNPASNRLIIQNKNNRNLAVALFTTQGRKVKELQLSAASGTINIQDVPKGMYILQVTDVTTGEKQSRLVVKG